MSDLIDTTEMYLRTIHELQEEGIAPLRARIAERLHQSGPTVSQTVARMQRDGLLTVTGDRHIELSDEGRELAVAVMRKHRLAERLLVDVIGLDLSLVHEEACRWEHVISEDVERRLVAILDSPDESPFGNPIPGLEALGGRGADAPFRQGVDSLAALLEAGSAADGLVLARISEHVQAELGLLEQLCAAGLEPGAALSAVLDKGRCRITVDGHEPISVSRAVADGLFVRVDSSGE